MIHLNDFWDKLRNKIRGKKKKPRVSKYNEVPELVKSKISLQRKAEGKYYKNFQSMTEDDQLVPYEIVEREIVPEKVICPDCGGVTLQGLDFCDKCGGELHNL